MNKEQIIKRAESDGTKAAKAMFYRDYATSKSYYEDMLNLWRYYPEFSKEIRDTYDKAYKEEYSSYQRPMSYR